MCVGSGCRIHFTRIINCSHEDKVDEFLIALRIQPSLYFPIYSDRSGVLGQGDVFEHEVLLVAEFADEGGEGEFGEEVFCFEGGVAGRHCID